jgi:hypothetical protein
MKNKKWKNNCNKHKWRCRNYNNWLVVESSKKNIGVEGKRLNWLVGHGWRRVPKRFEDDILKFRLDENMNMH